MKNPFRNRPRDNIGTLREALTMTRNSEVLHTIPDRLAEVITRYDSLPLEPTFRHDVYLILAGSLDVAEAVVDSTFSVDTATDQIGRQLEVLARLLNYMNRRPSRIGYSILIPETHTLVGQWGTEGEAEGHLDNLHALGSARNAIVVPVKITSQYQVQPRHVPQTAPISEPIDVIETQQVKPEPRPEPARPDVAALTARVDAVEAEAETMFSPNPAPPR